MAGVLLVEELSSTMDGEGVGDGSVDGVEELWNSIARCWG